MGGVKESKVCQARENEIERQVMVRRCRSDVCGGRQVVSKKRRRGFSKRQNGEAQAGVRQFEEGRQVGSYADGRRLYGE